MKNEESLKYVQAKRAARPKGISVNIFHRDFWRHGDRLCQRRGAAKEEQKTEKSRCDPPCEKAGDVRWSKNRQNKNYK